MNQAIQVYQQRLETYERKIQALDQVLQSLSTQRLLAFGFPPLKWKVVLLRNSSH